MDDNVVPFDKAQIGDLAETWELASGELVQGEFGWVAHAETFEDEPDVEVIRKVWRLVHVDRQTLNPSEPDEDDEP